MLMTFAVEVAPEIPVAEMTVDEVRRQLALNRRERARLDAEDLELLARLEVVCADPSGPFVMPERELMKHAGVSSRDAATMVGRVHTVTDIPALADVLASGATTAAHIDAMARGLKIAGGDKDKFLELAPSLVEAATTPRSPSSPTAACRRSNVSVGRRISRCGSTPTA